MKSSALHRFFGRHAWARKLTWNLRSRCELASLAGHKDRQVLQRIAAVRSAGRESLLSSTEAYLLHNFAAAQACLGGDTAEVGVYQGCSARLISLASNGRPLHLFDTFAGLPQPSAAEQRHLQEHQFPSSLESVRAFLADRPHIHFHPGLFPATATSVAGHRFSFVHLDVDLHASTRSALDFFYPRMLPGGILLTHDYSLLDGVRAAFTEFLADKPERAIELPTSQAMLICQGGAPARAAVAEPFNSLVLAEEATI